MAANDSPGAAETRKPLLSVEDAELFASQIRPSWELVDDSLRSDLAADLAIVPPISGAPNTAPPDTIVDGVPALAAEQAAAEEAPMRIVGVPTVSIGPASGSNGGAVPVDAGAAAAMAKPAADKPAADKPAADKPPAKVSKTLSDDDGGPALKPPEALPLPPPRGQPLGKPEKPGKTKVGMGSPVSSPGASAKAPISDKRPAPSKPGKTMSDAAPAKASSANTGAEAAAIPEDDIDIPIAGAPRGLMLKIGVVAAAAALVIGGVVMLGGSGDKKTPAVPSAVASTVAPPLNPPPPLQPEPKATAAAVAPSAAPVASAAPAASAAPKATAAEKPARPAPEPKPAPEPRAAPEPKKKPPAVAAPPPTKKGGGGIIRETPF